MSYRDDHEAAIARITALEQELADARDTAQEKSDRDRRRIAMLERELDDLQRHASAGGDAPRRARPPSTPPSPTRATPAAPIDELARRGPEISRALLAVLALVAAGVLALVVLVVSGDREPPAPTTCTVQSSPSGARVFGVANGEEVDLGSAPVELTFHEWSRYDTIQFRISGYDTLTVDAPTTPAQCPRDAYDLYLR